MARQPKKERKEWYECPKCGSLFLDVTTIYTDSGKTVYGKEYDCRECQFAWDSSGNEL
jgi:hypothetical protein